MTNEKKVLKKEQKTLETLLKDNLDNSENLSSASVIEELSQAMKINANGVFEKSGFDRDKARAYCWQSVGYQGEKKSKFGFLDNKSKDGISSLHGAHQVAQKFNKTKFPL